MKKRYLAVGVVLSLLLFAFLYPKREEMQIYDTLPSVLFGKSAVFLGDSLCAGTTVGEGTEEYGYGWGGMIGEKNEMEWVNYGRNGAVITRMEGHDRILSDQLDKAIRKYKDVDYIIFEGGCNDADYLKDCPEAFGTISDEFQNFDCSTFTGAFEQLIVDIITAYPNAKIGYVVPPKMGDAPYDSSANIRRQFYDRALQVCDKWGVPTLDLWNENPMNPHLEVFYDESISREDAAEKNKFYTDGQHLTLRGYERILSQIETFMCGL